METILNWAETYSIEVEYWKRLRRKVKEESLTGDKTAASLAIVITVILTPIRMVLNLAILGALKRAGFSKFAGYPPVELRKS